MIPLHNALRHGYLEKVKLLIASGALVNKANNDGITPLWFASQSGHLDIVKLLVASSDGDVNQSLLLMICENKKEYESWKKRLQSRNPTSNTVKQGSGYLEIL